MVLVGQQGGGDQDGTLTTVLCGYEGGAHGDLGLTKTHVAAHQTIHHLRCTHIVLNGSDGDRLIRRLLKGKTLAKPLPLGLVQLVRMANPGLASGINIE